MKKIISFFSGIGLLFLGSLRAIGPIGAIPVVGNIGAIVGGKAMGGLKKSAMETFANANITLMIAQIFFIVVFAAILVYCTIQICYHFKELKKRKFLKALNQLELEVLTKGSPGAETVSLMTELLGKYRKKFGEGHLKEMHKALGMIKGAVSQEEKRFLICALKRAIKLI